MSESDIPAPIRYVIWGKAGGRCEYRGCRDVLYRDPTTKAEFNQAYLAHIVADKVTGPRGDPVLSPLLGKCPSNIMLLCDRHHRLIDKHDEAGHPTQLLQEMKREHETRMELLQSLIEERQSHVLIYCANVGEHTAVVDFNKASQAMLPNYVPADHRPLQFGLVNSTFTELDQSYWSIELANLRNQFQQQLVPLLSTHEIKHVSVFGLAPMPLLMELGRLLSDIPAAEVFERQREPPGWKWNDDSAPIQFSLMPPANQKFELKDVALVLSLSATITPDRIHQTIGKKIAIWQITHAEPMPGFLKNRRTLMHFREILRQAFNRIKERHGEDARLHVFPAIPVSAAIEVGRVWMKKADLPFHVYDQNRTSGGFSHVHTIS